jgi:hypothetical protein
MEEEFEDIKVAIKKHLFGSEWCLVVHYKTFPTYFLSSILHVPENSIPFEVK